MPQLHTETDMDDVDEQLLAMSIEIIVMFPRPRLKVGDGNGSLAWSHGLDRFTRRPLLQAQLENIVLGTSARQMHHALVVAELMHEPLM